MPHVVRVAGHDIRVPVGGCRSVEVLRAWVARVKADTATLSAASEVLLASAIDPARIQLHRAVIGRRREDGLEQPVCLRGRDFAHAAVKAAP